MIADRLALPMRAAMEVAAQHGLSADRCDVLQDGHTLVLRLSESLVARVVTDTTGPRQGTEWFARENAIAQHLTAHRAPVIPLHSELPAVPHEHLGYPMNFWQFVTRVDAEPDPREIGRTLHDCHAVLRQCATPLPQLAIITESLAMLEMLTERALFDADVIALLRSHLEHSLAALSDAPAQPLHGDAHMGNLMQTTEGLFWTDWEDAFAGPVEWDLASIVWNAKFIEQDELTVSAILDSYRAAGGVIDDATLEHCYIARAAVMTAWYPILYPQPNAERQAKLAHRIAWLRARA